jgi:predicted DNA-binding transcriptional regulator AlpA
VDSHHGHRERVHARQTDSSGIGDHDEVLLRPIAAADVLGVPLGVLRRRRWQRRGPRPIHLSRGIVRYAPSELRAYLAQTTDPAIAVCAPRRTRHPTLAARPAHADGLAQGTEAIETDASISIPEAARRLAVSVATIARWRRTGRLGSGNWPRGKVSAAAIAELTRGGSI